MIDQLNDDDEIEAAWGEVATCREAEIERGEKLLIPIEAVLARLEARFSA